MARMDDLVARVGDPALRREMETALAELKCQQRFGLVFEEHDPEPFALPGLPVRVGALVRRRNDLSAKALYRVAALTAEGGTATLTPAEGGDPETVPVRDLLVVKHFGEPVYPVLTPLGAVQRGGDKPYHAVVNGENLLALQLFLPLFAGRVDCVYIDPPYNSGARDWKYNNHFADDADAWRHSKWLRFMEQRLRLAGRLLRPDGVLIVTIDEHEVHHLGMLLETLFPGAHRQMVTIVVNPKGVTQGRFSRVEEYAFFCFFGDAAVSGRGDDMLTPGIEEEDEEGQRERDRRPRWKGLLRSGANARRQDRENLFYPVLVDPECGAVRGAGEPLPPDEEPDFDAKVDGWTPVWPVRRDGSLGRWGVGHVTLRQLIEKGYVALGERDPKRRTWALRYLSKEHREQVDNGVLEVAHYDAARNVVDVRYTDVADRRVKTVWHRSRHDAGAGGSDLVTTLLGSRIFPFPKSLYAVRDCLAVVLRDRPDALVLDFFAGSGTTLHATALLNASDGGRRRSILVTNNEVDPETARKLHRDGHFPGDAEFERHGVFEQATRPRCAAAVTGRSPDGAPLPGAYPDGRPLCDGFPENVEFFRLDTLDPDAAGLARQRKAILPALWLAAGGVGEREELRRAHAFSLPPGSTFGVLFKESRFREFKEALAARPDVRRVWLTADSNEAFAAMRAVLRPHLCVAMLPRDCLRAFAINTERDL